MGNRCRRRTWMSSLKAGMLPGKGYKAGTKSEKRRIIEELIQAVQSRGNFLEKDKQHGWYVVDGDAIRKKVWQALREDRDPEKRRAKRKRFLAKKERMQN